MIEEEIENVIDYHDLFIFINKSPAHGNIAHGTFSAIDVTRCSLLITPKLQWDTLTELHDSGHFPIKITFPNPEPNITKMPKWNFKKTNWQFL